MTRRATQLRARFPWGTRLRLVWVVTNPALTLDELVDDAIRDAPDVLFAAGVEVAARSSTWHTQTGPDGSVWLVGDYPVRPWQDPRRDRVRRATTPAV